MGKIGEVIICIIALIFYVGLMIAVYVDRVIRKLRGLPPLEIIIK